MDTNNSPKFHSLIIWIIHNINYKIKIFYNNNNNNNIRMGIMKYWVKVIQRIWMQIIIFIILIQRKVVKEQITIMGAEIM